MDYTKYIEQNPHDKDKISLFLDKANRVKRTWEEAFTDFLNPDEQLLLEKICKNEGLYVCFMGGKGCFERAVASISTLEDEIIFPVDIIRVSGNFKFEGLTHRDYLGALLSIGIKREKIGDINVFDDGAEIWINREISSYVCFNLTKIKHTGIRAEIITYEEARVKVQEFKDLTINIPSMRLDCMVSSITGESRNSASNLIKSGNIKVNYSIVDEASRKVDEGDLLSIKGYGRYEIVGILGKTKSGRLNAAVKKFI